MYEEGESVEDSGEGMGRGGEERCEGMRQGVSERDRLREYDRCRVNMRGNGIVEGR